LELGLAIERDDDVRIGDAPTLASLAEGRRRAGDPEAALRRTNGKFVRRFQGVETRIAQAGRRIEETSLDEMDRHWTAIKQEERGG